MKLLRYILSAVLTPAFLFSCKKDNYSPPGTKLTGTLMYNGDSIHLEYNRVPYQLYQFGFGKVGPIEGTFTQSGVMSALLFNGEYKLIIPNGQGPFLWPTTASGSPDSLAISLNGDKEMNIEVKPYYMIRNAQITGGSGKVSATFAIDKIITDANARNIERVNLYVNRTQFVSGADQIASAEMSGADITNMGSVTLSVDVSALANQNYVFARVGLKIDGIEDMIFSSLAVVNY